MSTTIDSLQIEIQSNSTSAAQGIDALAVSLGKLKTNGSVGVAVKNLNNLTAALKGMTSVASNANKISTLADFMAKLKSVGSVGSGVRKLAESLQSFNNVDYSALSKVANAGDLFQRIAGSMSALSNVKSGGFGTMVNSLARIGQVTDSLDDDTIARFADRVSKLNDELTPLSTKMTTIQAGLRGVNSSAKSAGTGVKALGTKVNATTLNLASMITVIQGVTAAIMPLVRALSSVISEAIEWDGIAARFGRGFGPQAEEVYTWIQRLNKEMGINTQEFMQYASTYASMLTGFGVPHEDASKMALGYMELTYDAWAGYNDIYKRLGDSAEAIRSAIAGEVEPIRRMGLTITEATLQETAANHGLTISLQDATEAQKSYLRYLAITDAAHAQGLVGTYAAEMSTAEGAVRSLSQATKSLAQALGSLFIPVLSAVIPWIIAFVNVITAAIRAIAGFFGITIGSIDWSGFGAGVSGGAGALDDMTGSAEDATGALEDTGGAAGSAKKAIEDLKRATLGIDELNVISPPNESSGGGGSGGAGAGGGGGSLDDMFDALDVDSLWDESIFGQIEDKVAEIQKKLEEWLPVIGTIGTALAGLGIATLLKNIGDALAQMNLLQKALATVAIVAIEAALVFTFADNYLESGNLLYLIGEALVTAAAGYLLFRAWGPGGALLALSVSIAAQLVALEMNLADGTVSLSSPETWIQGITTTLMGAFGGAIISKNTGFFAKEGFVIGLGVTASLTLLAIRMGAIESGEISSDSVEAWILEIGSVLTAGLAGKWLGAALYTGGGPMGALIGVTAGLILNLVGTISVKGEDFGNEISDWISAGITAVMAGFTATKLWSLVSPYVTTALSGILPEIGAALSTALTTGWTAITGALAAIPVWGWIVAAIVGLLALAITDYDFTEIGHKIGEFIGKACRWVVDAADVVAGWAKDIGSAIWGAVTAAFEWCKENITWDNIVGFLSALVDPKTWTEIIWPKVKEIGLEIWNGIWEGIWGGVKNLWGNITEFVEGIIEGFKDGFGISSPAKTMIPIGGFIVDGLWEGISGAFKKIIGKISQWCKDLWDGFKSFFTSNDNKVDNVNVGVKLIKNGWTTVKGWIGDIPGVSQAISLIKQGWATVRGWVGNIPTLSQAISLIKNGWKTVKGWVGDIPVISQAVKLIKSGWTTVKGWIGSLPVISQTIKLIKSGWSSVKKWVGSIPTLSQSIKLVKSGWSSVKKWIGSIPKISQAVGLVKKGWSSVKKWVGGIPTLSAPIKLVKSGWSSVRSWLGGLNFKLGFTLPRIGINWGTKKFMGFQISYPKSFYTYAKGGFPDMGELFVAREAGPEMVGKIGNKTTVANNQQIVEGISEGVYAAVLAAMKASENDGGQAVNVYLDGKQIASSVEKRQHERGASLMGRQVYAY